MDFDADCDIVVGSPPSTTGGSASLALSASALLQESCTEEEYELDDAFTRPPPPPVPPRLPSPPSPADVHIDERTGRAKPLPPLPPPDDDVSSISSVSSELSQPPAPAPRPRPRPQPPQGPPAASRPLEQPPGPPAPAAAFLSLPQALHNLLTHLLHAAQARGAALGALPLAQQAGQPPAELDDGLVLCGMSEGLSLDAPIAPPHQLPPGDLGQLALTQRDVPGLHASPLIFRLGDKEALRTAEEIAVSPRLLDIHRPFCGLLLELDTRFTALTPRKDGLSMILFTWMIFEDTKGATEYRKRAWRFLTDNSLPSISEDERDHVTATMLYDTRLMQDEATWPLGDECACYGSLVGMQLPNYGGLAPGELLIVVIRVRNVVIKLTLASREDDEIDREYAYSLAQTAAVRARDWASKIRMSQTMEQISLPLQLFRQQYFAAWQRQAETQRLGDTPITMPLKDDCFECGVPTDGVLLCGGCRTTAYCSRECQKAHWKKGGHKQQCSREFEVFDDGCELFYKAHVPSSLAAQARLV